jgi:hypothetical protein
MGIPKIQSNDELPAGEHLASLQEIEMIYGSSCGRRKELIKGLYEATDSLEAAGVKTIWIDGSFVTSKKEPNDIDGCWEYTPSVDINMLDPIFLGDRTGMKKKSMVSIFLLQIILRLKVDYHFQSFFKKIGMAIQRVSLL